MYTVGWKFQSSLTFKIEHLLATCTTQLAFDLFFSHGLSSDSVSMDMGDFVANAIYLFLFNYFFL